MREREKRENNKLDRWRGNRNVNRAPPSPQSEAREGYMGSRPAALSAVETPTAS